METLNRVYLVGYLGFQPGLKIARNGSQYTRLSLATHRRWRNEAQQWEEKTDWHSILVWGPLAQTCTEKLQKGSALVVEGYLSSFEVQSEDSLKSYRQSITAQKISFLSHRSNRYGHPPTEELEEVVEEDGLEALLAQEQSPLSSN